MKTLIILFYLVIGTVLFFWGVTIDGEYYFYPKIIVMAAGFYFWSRVLMTLDSKE